MTFIHECMTEARDRDRTGEFMNIGWKRFKILGPCKVCGGDRGEDPGRGTSRTAKFHSCPYCKQTGYEIVHVDGEGNELDYVDTPVTYKKWGIREGWEDDLGIQNPFPKEYVVTIIYDAEMSMKHRSSGPLDQVKHHAGWRVKRYGGAFNGGDRYDDRSEVSWLFTDYATARAFAEDMNHFFFTPDVTDPEEYDEDEAQRAALGIDPETEAPFGQRIGVLDILVSIIDSESKESDVRSILSAQ